MRQMPECVKKLIKFGKRHHIPYGIIIGLAAILLFFYHLGYSITKVIKGRKETKGIRLAGLGMVLLLACVLVFGYESGLFGVIEKAAEVFNQTPQKPQPISEQISDNTTRVVQEKESQSQDEELAQKETNKPQETDLTPEENPKTGNMSKEESQPESGTEDRKDKNDNQSDDSKKKPVSDYKPKATYNGCPYYISVNRLKNCVTIYESDTQGNYSIPVKAMRCSTGGEETPLGVYSAGERYLFRPLFYGVYGQYAVRVVNDILFHSSSYKVMSKDTLIAEEFNKLGQSVSHGCIRLTVEDAKWIYDNCAYGTIVEIYEDEVAGPIGKPKVIKIPADSVWDPTDPDVNNPWNSAKPSIEGVDELGVQRGTQIDLLDGIKATDSCGNDITGQIKIKGEYSLDVPGTYEIIYYVKDLLGRKAKEKTKIHVF